MMLKKPVLAMLIFVYSSLALSELLDPCPTLKQEAIESVKEQEGYSEISQAFQLACQDTHGEEKDKLPRSYATNMFKKGSKSPNKPQYDFPEKVLEYTSNCYQQSNLYKELDKTDLAEGILYFSIKLHKNRISSAHFRQRRRQHKAYAENLIETLLADLTKQEEMPQPTPVDNTELATTGLHHLELPPTPLKEVSEVEPIKNTEDTTTSFDDLDTTSPYPVAYLDLFLEPLKDIRPPKRPRHSNHFFEDVESNCAEQNMPGVESTNSSQVSTNEGNTLTSTEELEEVLAKEAVPSVFDNLYLCGLPSDTLTSTEELEEVLAKEAVPSVFDNLY